MIPCLCCCCCSVLCFTGMVLHQLSAQLRLATLEEAAEGGDERYNEFLYGLAVEVTGLLTTPAQLVGAGSERKQEL